MRLILPAAVLLLLGAADVPAADLYQGAWQGDALRVDLRSADGNRYEGVITRDGRQYPLQATGDARALTGTFSAGEARFDFYMSPELGGTMLLRSGKASHRLKRVSEAATDEKAVGKDPLAYRVLQFPGGTIAQFDNWVYGAPAAANNVIWCDGIPKGQQDFVLRAAIATPNARDQDNLFVTGPQLVEQRLQLIGPGFRRAGEPARAKCGGDEALILEYHGTVQGKWLICRVMFVKRADVAIAVLGIGTDEGFRDFGRSIEIVAQSITLKETAVEPGLVGTWVLENYVRLDPKKVGDQPFNLSQSRSITLYPNGTFADTANTGFSGQDVTGLAKGGSRGKVVRRGTVLTFHYDDGTTWSAPYELYSNGLKLNGRTYLRQ